MAVPKRRKSQSRTRTRCAHDSLTPANTQNCPNCGEATLPHRMCNHCGHYRGRAIKEVAET